MSLKAKIEAVVYAAEEPVTLAQLAGLFADEALAWKQEREAEAAQATEPTLDEALEGAEPVAEPELIAEPVPTGEVESEAATVPEASPAEDSLPPSEEEPAAAVDPAVAEAEAKRAQRQRDREVRDVLRGILDELIADYQKGDSGLEVREIAGGYRFATKPEYHDSVRAFVKSLKPPLKLSLQALETLAVIAYKQPITAPEVGEIRGVDSAGVLGSLISRKLVSTAGRKQVIGRPILYKTTKEFLMRFGLKDLGELPSMEEFEKMAAGELSDMDTESEATPTTGELPLEEAEISEREPVVAETPEEIGAPEPREEAVAVVETGKPATDEVTPEPEMSEAAEEQLESEAASGEVESALAGEAAAEAVVAAEIAAEQEGQEAEEELVEEAAAESHSESKEAEDIEEPSAPAEGKEEV